MEGPASEATDPDAGAEPDAHHADVADYLLDGLVTPFLGAGANLCGRPPEADWEKDGFLPNGGELAGYLAKRNRYPSDAPRDLPRVAQFIDIRSRPKLQSDVRQLLGSRDKPPSDLHRFLAELPRLMRARGHGRHLVIVTTNYDGALELAFREAHEPFDLLTYAAVGPHRGLYMHRVGRGAARPVQRPKSYLSVGPRNRPVILKIHGTYDETNEYSDSYVISEDDYIDYMVESSVAKIPVEVKAALGLHHFLFLGYGLSDWNLRVFLRQLATERGRDIPSWAVQKSPQPLEREFWSSRGVDIREEPLESWLDKVRTAIGSAQ